MRRGDLGPQQREWNAETDAHGDEPREDGGREGRGAATNRGTPRIAGSHQELGARREQTLPLSLQKETILPKP